MSEFIRIEIPGAHVSQYRVSRVTNTHEATLTPNAVSTYRVDVEEGSVLKGWRTVTHVTHRYGDGALALAVTALTAIQEHR
jgi:hypothetical protein